MSSNCGWYPPALRAREAVHCTCVVPQARAFVHAQELELLGVYPMPTGCRIACVCGRANVDVAMPTAPIRNPLYSPRAHVYPRDQRCVGALYALHVASRTGLICMRAAVARPIRPHSTKFIGALAIASSPIFRATSRDGRYLFVDAGCESSWMPL